ncbi:kelch-like protein 12 [Clavelina lepadiformis]|uniref:kelch-like protein 12 n=1 Tax=Clavelina lepadiformis TaxID=159417 RepID=UPI0040433FE1
MASIINFMYTSCIILTHDNVYDVLEAAEYLRITSLKENCRTFFKASLNGENCLKIRSYSNRYDMGDLDQAAETFISKNLRAVLKSADFLQFGVDDVKAMLKLESVEDSIDEEKYRSVVAWALHDLYDRRKNFCDFFHLIQLENLTKDLLIKVVQKEKLVCSSTDCMRLLVTSLVSRISDIPACKAKPDQSDEILMIGGKSCPQSVAKFNTKTNQWSNMPVFYRCLALLEGMVRGRSKTL